MAPLLWRSTARARSFAPSAGKHRKRIPLPEITIDAGIDLHLADDQYCISACFNISLPGVDRNIAQSLVEEAEEICTYSKATRGNVDVVFNLV